MTLRPPSIVSMERLNSVSSINDFDSERQVFALHQATKPLPPLPRGWSRVRHEIGLFLRSIGLGIVVSAFQGFFTKNFQEPEKIAIRRNRITAFFMTLIHAVPVGIAILEIIFNWQGRFVGEKFNIQNYLQFAAKAHEVLIQSSVATILLSYIRHQINTNAGMPFGAVLSGLQFSQINYLWSVELWSSLFSKDFKLRNKLEFASFIFICIAIAVTAGPSSANLIIARQGLWPAESTYLAVNATIQDLWPDRLDNGKIDRDCTILGSDTTKNSARCPLQEVYDTLADAHLRLKSLPNSTTISQLDLFEMPGSVGELDYTTVLLVSNKKYPEALFYSTIPQAGVADGFFLNFMLYINATRMGAPEGYFFMQKNYYQPYTVVSCVTDVAGDDSDQTPLRFARIPETSSEFNTNQEVISITGLTKNQFIKKVLGDNSRFSVDWVDLPQEMFNTGIPGTVIVDHQDLNGSYNIYTCTLNAGWGSSGLTTYTLEGGAVFTQALNIPPSWQNPRTTRDAYGYAVLNAPVFSNISNISYPQRRIRSSKNWMESLNPTIKLADNSSVTFISQWLSSVPQPEELDVSQIVSMLFAVKLSYTGIEHPWEVFPDKKAASRACNACLIFEMENTNFGWLYNVHETTTKLAIAVMLSYCVLVLGHIVYTAVSGVSSTAWDSVAELVALAMNSTPTKILQNTCAGIIGRNAFKTPVRVLAKMRSKLRSGCWPQPRGIWNSFLVKSRTLMRRSPDWR